MDLPDIARLTAGEEDAWAAIFHWLWPAATAKARMAGMGKCCPDDVEDVASKSLSLLIGKVKDGVVKRTEDLKAFLAQITHDEAVSWCRGLFAQKRGGGKTGSLDAMKDDEKSHFEPGIEDSPLAKLELSELGDLIRDAGRELKPSEWSLLEDYFYSELSYKEIAEKHEIAVGSVGVYLKRSLDKLSPLLKKFI